MSLNSTKKPPLVRDGGILLPLQNAFRTLRWEEVYKYPEVALGADKGIGWTTLKLVYK